MKERIERVKSHLRENKKVYLSGTIGVGIGAVGALLTANKSSLVKNAQIQLLTWKSNQTLEVFIEALGDPGNIIQDNVTGTIYASQGQAARELGISASEISKHLNGKKDHVSGHIFTRLGKAAVAE